MIRVVFEKCEIVLVFVCTITYGCRCLSLRWLITMMILWI